MKQTTQVGTPERFRDGWKVPSGTGKGFHFVHLTPRWRCTCASWVYSAGKQPCKHLLAVQTLLSTGEEVAVV